MARSCLSKLCPSRTQFLLRTNLVRSYDYKLNLWPSWSQVENPDSQNTANFSTSCREVKRRKQFWNNHHRFTSSQLGTKFAPRIICNRNFVASSNKVSALIIPNLGIIAGAHNSFHDGTHFRHTKNEIRRKNGAQVDHHFCGKGSKFGNLFHIKEAC